MFLPELSGLGVSQSRITTFGGLNTTINAAQNEFSEMLNMTSDFYPVLATRQKRYKTVRLRSSIFYGSYYKEGLYYAARALDGKIYLLFEGVTCQDDQGHYIELYNFGSDEKNKRTFVGMGAYLLIFPDKLCYNTKTKELTKLQDVADLTEVENSPFRMFLSDKEGNEYYLTTDEEKIYVSGDSGETRIFCRQVGSGWSFYAYDEKAKEWKETDDVYLCLRGDGVLSLNADISAFKKGDVVNLDTVPPEEADDVFPPVQAKIISIPMGIRLRVIFEYVDGIFLIAPGEDMQSVGTPITTYGFYMYTVVPDMDFVLEANNRIWGCSSKNREIYACKLGDPKRWYSYEGTSLDSFTVTIGTDGDFTGAINYNGYPIFFKENYIHKIYGNYPANFQLSTATCRGVEKGSGKSLAVVGGVLLYKGIDGIYAYDGSLPEKISAVLDGVELKNVVAAAYSMRYYFFSQKDGKADKLYCFDMQTGLFTEEDSWEARELIETPNEIYITRFLADEPETRYVYSMHPPYGGRELLPDNYEEDITWSCTTGWFGKSDVSYRYVVRVALRLQVEEGGYCDVAISYDDSDKFVHLCRINGSADMLHTPNNVVYQYMNINRCNKFRLKLNGKKQCKIYSIDLIEEAAEEANHGKF